MGYLFENAEKMDIQAERQNTKKERERADAAKQRADAAKQRADAAKQRADAAKQRADAAELRFNQAIDNFILYEKASGKTKEDVSESLQVIYGITEADAQKRIEPLWT